MIIAPTGTSNRLSKKMTEALKWDPLQGAVSEMPQKEEETGGVPFELSSKPVAQYS